MRAVIFLLVSALLLAGCGNRSASTEEAASPAKGSSPDTSQARVVSLSPDVVAANHFATAAVARNSGFITTQFAGRVEFNRNTTAYVLSPMEGRLKEWRARLGDRVHQGDVLALVESPQNLGEAIPVRASIDGEVIEQNGAIGGPVRTEEPLFVIGDPSTLWAIADVREELVGKVIAEGGATIRSPAFPGETFKGRLLRAAERVAPETRTVPFYLEVPNPERKLRAGMFAYVSLATDRIRNSLFVPDEAVQTVDGTTVVFVEEQAGTYRMADVRLGRKSGEWVEVLDGLADGAVVVTHGSFILKSEILRGELTSGD